MPEQRVSQRQAAAPEPPEERLTEQEPTVGQAPVPDWQEGFVPPAESEDESNQSDEDDLADF